MDDSIRKRLTWLGLVISAIGLGLGFMPVSTGPVSCGSAFGGGGNALARDFASRMEGWPGEPSNFAALCADTLQPWRLVAIVLIALGLALAVVFRTWKRREPEQTQPRQPTAA